MGTEIQTCRKLIDDGWIGRPIGANALADNREMRAGGDLAYHVLDIMHAFHDASDQGKHMVLESTCERPTPMAIGLLSGMLE